MPAALAWPALDAIDLHTALWLSLACLVAYFLKGFSGFGSAMVFVPSVAALFDPRTALASSALVDLFVGLALLSALRYERGDLRVVLRLAGFMALGTLIGSTLAGIVPAALLLRVITVVILGFGLSLIAFHRPLPVSAAVRGDLALDAGCILGGITGGLVGISGPFLIVVLRPRMDKGRFRRILVALFLIEGVVKLASYAVVGVWTASTVPVAVVAAPAIVVGALLGMKSHARVDERVFSVAVGVILVGLAVRLLVG